MLTPLHRSLNILPHDDIAAVSASSSSEKILPGASPSRPGQYQDLPLATWIAPPQTSSPSPAVPFSPFEPSIMEQNPSIHASEARRAPLLESGSRFILKLPLLTTASTRARRALSGNCLFQLDIANATEPDPADHVHGAASAMMLQLQAPYRLGTRHVQTRCLVQTRFRHLHFSSRYGLHVAAVSPPRALVALMRRFKTPCTRTPLQRALRRRESVCGQINTVRIIVDARTH